MCVWLKFEHVFSMCCSPALKLVFIFSAKHVRLLYGSWFRNPTRKNKTMEKVSADLHFKYMYRDVPGKVQKRGRDERTLQDYPESAVYFCSCGVVFLRSVISALVLYFFQAHPYLNEVIIKTFFLVCL